MSSKDDAAVWAPSCAGGCPVVGTALVLRRGHHSRSLERTDVRAFVLGVKTRIERVLR